MPKQDKTIIVFFNLKKDANESDYIAWAKGVDLPTVNGLNSVNSFEVFKGISLLGEQKSSPWQYFEIIHIRCEEAFLTDIQTNQMGKVIEQFQAFSEDATFISTQNINSL